MGFNKQATIDTYAYLEQQLSQRRVAFVEMERYMAFLDYHNRGTKDFEPVTELKQYFTGGTWIANGGYDVREAEATIRAGRADAISFSRPFIANPDLVQRLKHNYPLAEPNWDNVYGQMPGTKKDNDYSDYPDYDHHASNKLNTNNSNNGNSSSSNNVSINATSSINSVANSNSNSSSTTSSSSSKDKDNNNLNKLSNKSLVLHAFDTLFNRRDYAVATQLWSPDYIQHSAHIGPGRDGLFSLVRSMPTLRWESGQCVADADGDTVMVHSRFTTAAPAGAPAPAPPALITVDIVRIDEQGRLAEHWDVWQNEVAAVDSKSGQPMFGQTFP